MYILEVVPLTKIPLHLPQILSYFSPEKVEKGALVLIPLRKRKVLSLVINTESVKEKKLEIKKASFKLKKIERVIVKKALLSDPQLSLAQWLSERYLSPLGLTLKLFLPKKILKSKRAFSKIDPFLLKEKKEKKKTLPLLFWGKNLFDFYLKEIKKYKDRGEQILILEPELEALSQRLKELKLLKIPESEISLFHKNLSQVQEFQEWQKIKKGKAKIILGTKSALFLPFQDLGLIIVDQEESSSFESWGKEPRYNAKEFSLKLAEISGAKIIFASHLPGLESYYYAKKGKYRLEISSNKYQMVNVKIIDMRAEIKEGNFSIFSKALQESLKKLFNLQNSTLKNAGRQGILFINRRGLATTLLCQECGEVIKCKNCDVPLVYHLEKKRPCLICHHCGQKEVPPTFCLKCQGWRLKLLGKGTQKVFEELRKILPNAKILRLDSDIAPTPEKQKKILKAFIKKEADILVATQLLFQSPILNYQSPFLVAVISIDSLLNLPEFRSRERVFQLLWKLRFLAQEMIIQTYNPNLSIFRYFQEGKSKDFFKEELRQRKAFGYPPFSEIIRLTFSHKNSQKAQREAQEVKENITKSLAQLKIQDSKAQILGPAPSFIPKIRGKYVWQIIIKIKGERKKIGKAILSSLSPKWKIEVNPVSLL